MALWIKRGVGTKHTLFAAPHTRCGAGAAHSVPGASEREPDQCPANWGSSSTAQITVVPILTLSPPLGQGPPVPGIKHNGIRHKNLPKKSVNELNHDFKHFDSTLDFHKSAPYLYAHQSRVQSLIGLSDSTHYSLSDPRGLFFKYGWVAEQAPLRLHASGRRSEENHSLLNNFYRSSTCTWEY